MMDFNISEFLDIKSTVTMQIENDKKRLNEENILYTNKIENDESKNIRLQKIELLEDNIERYRSLLKKINGYIDK